MSQIMTSYIRTTGATAARGRDKLTFAFPPRPQAVTLYVQGVELGTSLMVNARVLHVGADDSVAFPNLELDRVSGGYRIQFAVNAVDFRVSALAAFPPLGTLFELRGVVGKTGIVQLHQSIVRAAETSGSASSALPLPAAWAGQVLQINAGSNTTNGIVGIRNVHLERGVHSMEAMRRLAGTA